MKINLTKKISLIILPVFLLLLFFFTGCNNSYQPEPEKYWVRYSATDGGKVEGTKAQFIKHGEDAEEVTAIAEFGYYFVKWSDGQTSATRQDKNITKEVTLTAEFAEITDGVKANYLSHGLGYVSYNGIHGRDSIEQVVQRGTDAWKVVAIPSHYNRESVFIRWSDGVTVPERHDKNVTEDFEVTALFGYRVTYNVQGNGSIVGNSNQLVVHLEHAETVTALPDKGYTFVGWSDGVKEATRQDTYLMQSMEVTAIFEWRETDNFTYHYNYSTSSQDIKYLTLTRGEVAGMSGVVPERDYFTFGGWYLDENFTEKAISEKGEIILGEEIFNSPSRDLYAKWTVIDKYVVTYKILMVYVTAEDAVLVDRNGNNVELHYRMSELERKICNEITGHFCDTLNDYLDGLVKFEIDSYFTTQTIGEESFSKTNYGEYYVSAENIEEVAESGLLDNYRSVIATYSYSYISDLYSGWVGLGGIKYAQIPLDRLFAGIKFGGRPEDAFAHDFNWDDLIETYVHEFIHTVEMGIVSYEYHSVCGNNNQVLSAFEISHLYLLNQCPVELNSKIDSGVRVGIPYTYWTNEIFTVICDVDESKGGYVGSVWDNWDIDSLSVANQQVPKGSRLYRVVAEANNGYRFVGWSDGVKDAERIFYDVQHDIHITAMFEKITYTVNVTANEGGKIESKFVWGLNEWSVGDTSYNMYVYDSAIYLTAIADEGYRFVMWSDGSTQAERTFGISSETIKYFDEDNTFTISAVFEKTE